jgi:isoleucyl-tRNA synthetase
MSENKKANFILSEEEVLSFWEKAEIFLKSVKKEAPKANFVFYEGPPTANGMPGIHHVLARAFKDCIPRYKTMQGFKVERKAGWDTHGLPVELKVEKDLGISGKQDIEKYGIEKFNKKCRESVWQYTDEWKKLTNRIAFWLDLENPYITYENDYIQSLWWIIKQVYEKDLLYRGHKVVPHCPRCGTALSSHEVAQGYKLVKDKSLFVKFKLLSNNDLVKEGDYILAWTTTAWTLPGNVALAVGEEIDYLRVKKNKDFLIIAKELAGKVLENDYEIISQFKGKDLVNLNYQPLFDLGDLFKEKKSHYISLADFVSTEDGTGVVHTAVMYGEDDYNLGLKIDLPKVHTVNEEGKFIKELEKYELANRFVKSEKTETIILEYLEKNNYLYKEELYEHDYPYCWRCDTPLLYFAKNSWFIKMSQLKEKLIENNKQINWIPEHIKEGRFGEWLRNVKDWAISRERYWGTPLPIWICNKCEKIKCIGSKDELKVELEDLHRPYIDQVKFTCDCGGEMIRDLSVLDCWFDSGAMPLAQHHYPLKNQNLIDENKQYPADFICEAIDQTRGWFYTLLAISTLLDKEAPYKNVICLGHVNDKEGKKMSKSKGNVVDPWEVIEKFGVDAVRQHMYTLNQPGEGKKYDLDDVRDVFRQNIMLINNIYRFYSTFSNIKDLGEKERPKTENILDKWILSRLDKTTLKITSELENYHIYEAAREIPLLIDDLSTWYLRRSRDRFKGEDENDKNQAINTTAFVLIELSKLMAPFMPFIAEQIYQKTTNYNFSNKDKSVHLSTWPKAKEADQAVIEKMADIRKLVELGLAKRDEAQIKIRQKLATAFISGPIEKLEEDYVSLLVDELNVLDIKFVEKKVDWSLSLDINLTPELKLAGLERDIIRLVNAMRKQKALSLEEKTTIYYSTDDSLVESLEKIKDSVLKATLSEKFERKEDFDFTDKKSLEFEGKIIKLAI